MINKIKSLAGLAYKNDLGRKKYKRTVFLLLTMSLFVCMGVFWTILSLEESMENISDKPLARQLQIIDNTDDDELYNIVKTELGGMEGIEDITRLIPFTDARWKDTGDIFYSSSAGIYLVAYFNGMDKYRVSGTNNSPQKGEIIIPKYLYGLGELNDYEYVNGEDFIGEEIKISVWNEFLEKNNVYTFQVAGTYDNINSQCMSDLLFINDEEADEIYTQKFSGVGKYITELKKQYREELKQDPTLLDDVIENPYTKHYIGVYVKSGYDIEKIKNKITDITGEISFEMQETDKSLIAYYQMIEKLCRLILLMLLSVTFANMIIMIVTDIKRRQKEIIIWQIMGYGKKDIVFMLIMEHIWISLKSFFTALILSLATITAVNYIIQNCLAFYRRVITINCQWDTVWMIAAIMAISVFISIFISVMYIKKYNLSESLGEE
jgi:cell division protein FtsX